jgi:hypothetical protein
MPSAWDPDTLDPHHAVDRRTFVKAAVAIGGASALSACLERFDDADPIPTGVDDPSTLPERQHGWNDALSRDDAGNVVLPRHQTLLYCTLPGDGPPGEDDRAAVESALSTLDRAFERSPAGVIHSVAYSPAYFERYDASLPDSVDLPRPRELSSFEDPTFDEQAALVHLASDRADAVLSAEAALTGERETVNGEDVETPLTAALEVDDRRTGFFGPGMPAERADGLEGIPQGNPVPEASPLFMGFKAGFAGNQATEDHVTIGAGPFAGGTTKHVSNLRQRLADWYVEQNYAERVQELFSPGHDAENLIEGVGENLGADSGIDQFLDDLDAHAREFGRVGHAQKAARANRDDDGNVRLLRRHIESTDDDVASLHFPSLQRGITAFEEVRRAMNGADLTDNPAIRQRVNNGILEYVFTTHRGNFLVPPRRHRALPAPRPG